MSLPETMAMTGHYSVATVMGYFPRRKRARQHAQPDVDRLLDND
jgi:hypothetical protein